MHIPIQTSFDEVSLKHIRCIVDNNPFFIILKLNLLPSLVISATEDDYDKIIKMAEFWI